MVDFFIRSRHPAKREPVYIRSMMNWRRSALCLFFVAGATAAAAGAPPKVTVRIVDRKNLATTYTYVVPGRIDVEGNSTASCSGSYVTTCSGTASATGTETPPVQSSFTVSGATLTLQVPDGRIVVVNCASKFAERFRGPLGNRRSCRVPLNNVIQAQFKGDNAKLYWNVSLDDSKQQSETYKILAVFGSKTAGPPHGSQ